MIIKLKLLQKIHETTLLSRPSLLSLHQRYWTSLRANCHFQSASQGLHCSLFIHPTRNAQAKSDLPVAIRHHSRSEASSVSGEHVSLYAPYGTAQSSFLSCFKFWILLVSPWKSFRYARTLRIKKNTNKHYFCHYVQMSRSCHCLAKYAFICYDSWIM